MIDNLVMDLQRGVDAEARVTISVVMCLTYERDLPQSESESTVEG